MKKYAPIRQTLLGLWFIFLILLTACNQSEAGQTTNAQESMDEMPGSAGLEKGPSFSQAPQGYASYRSPNWVSFHYPEDWYVRGGESVLDLVVKNGPDPLRAGLGMNGAAIVVHQSTSTIDDPIQAIEHFLLEEVGDDMIILEAPETILLNGQPAATALVSYPGHIWPSLMGSWLSRIVVVAGSDQLVILQAISNKNRAEQHESTFDLILDSIVVGDKRVAPAVGEQKSLPVDYAEYEDTENGFVFSHPAEWESNPIGTSSESARIVHPPASEGSFCSVTVLPAPTFLLPYIRNMNESEYIQAFFDLARRGGRVSNVKKISDSTQVREQGVQTIRMFVSASVPNEIPARTVDITLFLFNQTSTEDMVIWIVGLVEDEECQVILETVMDSVALTP